MKTKCQSLIIVACGNEQINTDGFDRDIYPISKSCNKSFEATILNINIV